MARSKSSGRWLREHHADPYVQQARREGFRSRAVYKLQEIQTQNRILRPGMTVVDLGAAPGSWSQYAAQQVGPTGQIIALDILAMEPLMNVQIIQGDFREATVLQELLAVLQGRKTNVVISDMAPNMSGIKAVDQPAGMYLTELAVDLTRQTLASGGTFLSKAFQGEGFDKLLTEMRQQFSKVVVRKPKSSRSRSAELYLLAMNYNPR